MDRRQNNGPQVDPPDVDEAILIRALIIIVLRLAMKVTVILAAIGTYWILDSKFDHVVPNHTMITIQGNSTPTYTSDVHVLDYDAWGLDDELVDEEPREEDYWDNEENEYSEKRIIKDDDDNEVPDRLSVDYSKIAIHPLVHHLIRLHHHLMIREFECGIPMTMEMIEFFDRLFKSADSDVVKLYQEGMQYIDLRANEIQRVCGWDH